VKVIKLRHTCYAMPAQWEGRCDDGKWVYVRYRFGRLSVRVGVGKEALCVPGEYVFEKECGGDWDGDMTFEKLRQHTPNIQWPEKVEPLKETWLDE